MGYEKGMAVFSIYSLVVMDEEYKYESGVPEFGKLDEISKT